MARKKPKRKAAAAEQPEVFKTRKAAAKKLGVTERQLGNWVHEEWFPADGKTEAGWNVTAIREARDAHGRKGSEASDQAKRLKLATDDEKLKQAQYETRRKELALRQQEGELLPRAGWELFAATLLTQLGDWCDQLPELVAGDVPKRHAKKVRDRLRQELDAKRQELRDELERQARDLDRQTDSAG